MRSALFSVKLLKTFIFVLLTFSLKTVLSQSIPLPNAFAHNDYFHDHPLFDALYNGYTNIEVDIFLNGDNLIVAHINPYFKSDRTLERLYLKPLAERIAMNDGRVFKDYYDPVILMIDIKTDADDTYKALKKLLKRYSSVLTSYNYGIVSKRAVTVVLSGHKPYKMIKEEQNRMAFIDEDLRETNKDTTAINVYTLSSCKYSKLLKWTGRGPIPNDERNRLCAYIIMAHRFGKKVRLWASPENDVVWTELLKCGVDLINTDKLPELKNFLLAYSNDYNSPALMLTAGRTMDK